VTIRLGKNDKRSIAIPILGFPGKRVRSSIRPSKLAADQVNADTDGGLLCILTNNAIAAKLNEVTKKNTDTKIANNWEEIFLEIVIIVVV
jgi:hypothetical protein